MAYKNIIFDMGKVLIDFDFSSFYLELGYDPSQRSLEEANVPVLLFESGKIDRKEFYAQLAYVYDISLSQARFENLWCSIFMENREMIELAGEMKAGFDIFIFSNTDELHFPYVWERYPGLHIFGENLMLSYELGAVKPDLKAYEKALSRFSLNPEDSIFIDDRPANIEAAEKLGIKGILHKDNSRTRETLLQITRHI